MIIRVVQGKGGKDRDIPLSPALLETLRAYWRWSKRQVYLFPSRDSRKLGQPISDKQWLGWGQLSVDGSRHYNSVWSEDPWGRAVRLE